MEEIMLRFIFTMLFYGVFLGVLAILCMWFFLGVTIQQSIDWLLNKVGQTTEVVSDGASEVGKAVKNASTVVDRQLEKVNNSF